jgi:hypothetical protein
VPSLAPLSSCDSRANGVLDQTISEIALLRKDGRPPRLGCCSCLGLHKSHATGIARNTSRIFQSSNGRCDCGSRSRGMCISRFCDLDNAIEHTTGTVHIHDGMRPSSTDHRICSPMVARSAERAQHGQYGPDTGRDRGRAGADLPRGGLRGALARAGLDIVAIMSRHGPGCPGSRRASH